MTEFIVVIKRRGSSEPEFALSISVESAGDIVERLETLDLRDKELARLTPRAGFKRAHEPQLIARPSRSESLEQLWRARLAELGQYPQRGVQAELCRRWHCSAMSVHYWRKRLGMPAPVSNQVAI